MSGWSRTYTGKKFHPANPALDEICIEDIAHHLSMICRFTGALRVHFSVAQHSLLVSALLPAEHKLWGLLHDSSEGYISDVTRPAKCDLPDYKKMEERIMKVVAERFDLPWPMPCEVKQADMVALVSEATHHHPWGTQDWGDMGVDPLSDHPFLHPLPQPAAKYAFLREFARLDRERMGP